MLRYLRRLSDQDFALDRGMIPLGSCTMKLNATTEMEPVGLPGFRRHPSRSRRSRRTPGYLSLIDELEGWLAEVTGYAKVSVQPNAGSQGELAGLLAIAAYHRSRGDEPTQRLPDPVERTRDQCGLRGHGRHACRGGGRARTTARSTSRTCAGKCEEHHDRLAAIMVTYPSTHGVYEEGITEMCALVHQHGGQVYIDGANLNALLGLAEPGKFGGDVSHLNLHKTFCIPHGGGGPGVGPVAVAEHLVPVPPVASVAPASRTA